MILDIQYLASSKRMECQSKAQNEQPLKHILSIKIFYMFLEKEKFHFLYFSSCIYVSHTLKESSFLVTKGLLFLMKSTQNAQNAIVETVTNLIHLLGLFNELRCHSLFYEHAQKNCYQLQILLLFYQFHYHLAMKKFWCVKCNTIYRMRILRATKS